MQGTQVDELADKLAETTTAERLVEAQGQAAPLCFTRLNHDDLAHIWRLLSPDDHLAAALSCKILNAQRPRRRKFPWYGDELGEEMNPMITERIKTRLLATMRSDSLQAWAASIGCPSIYPHWVELCGLSSQLHNGRVGRALAPSNEQGRMPVEVDSGLGELPQRGKRRSPSLKPISVRQANVRVLTALDSELVYAVCSEGGRSIGNWEPVLLPRKHSCFRREQHATTMIESFGSQPDAGANEYNRQTWPLGGKDAEAINEINAMLLKQLCQGSGPLTDPERSGEAMWSFPLSHARWAAVQRSPLLAKCGVLLAIQRVEAHNSRDRMEMDNQLATLLMIDTGNGFAPQHWQDGIGDVYIYKSVPAHHNSSASDPEHLSIDELGFIWQYISGDLASGEYVRDANLRHYQGRRETYLNRT